MGRSRSERAARIVPKTLGGEVGDGGANAAPRILGTVAHHPHLLEPMLKFSMALADGVLPRRASEILALRAAWNCRSAFEWGHHARYARDAGLSEVEITRIASGPDAPGWSPADALLLRAADELHANQDLADETWTALSQTWDEAQLVEIPFVVGQYTMLSMVAKSTGVPVDPDLPTWPDLHPSRERA
jgi:4-carboxymuconolactone decarboxylase